MTAILRLGIAVILFLVSSLTIVPVLSYNLWKASLVVAEWGHFIALAGLLMLLPGWRRTRASRIAAILGVATFVLSLTPFFRGVLITQRLPERIESAFGTVKPRSLPDATPMSRPLAIGGLFSKPASPEVRVSTLPYVVREGVPLKLALYRREGTWGPLPVVVVIHGGSWTGGGRGDLAALNSYLASRGYAVAAIGYRFAPKHPHPASTQDVNAAIDYLKANARRLEIDSTRVALIGRSAGGQLALLSAYTKNDPAIRGVVAFYPPTDQKWGWENPSDPRVYDSFGVLRNFLQGDPTAVPEAYRTSSPINYVGAHTIPTLLIHGGMDPLVSVRQSVRLDSALTAARRPHLFVELPWATHGCDYVFNGPCGQISTYATERFLAAVMK